MTTAPFLLANAGLPMLAMQLPLLVLLLVPIILLEGAVIARWSKRTWRDGLRLSAAANVVSTLVGIPLTWGVLLALQIAITGAEGRTLTTLSGRLYSAVLQAPWLLPHPVGLEWLVPTANLVLLPFYFLASVYSERWVLRRSRLALSLGEARVASWLANGASYALLLLGSVVWLVGSGA